MIPKCISDISHDWITSLMKKLNQISDEKTDCSITSLSLNTSTCNEELFEACRLSFTFETTGTDCISDGNFHEIPATHHWLVKLMPSDPDLRDIVFRHDLFKKEMLVHQVVITQLHNFVEKERGNTDDTNVLPLPKLLHGEYDDEAQNGVMVFTDYRENHYELADSDLKRISSQNQIEKVISTLATFHSICTAFEQSHRSSFEQIFPFLSTDQGAGNIWFHADMQVYVEEMYDTCLEFLKSIPGQEETSKWFEQRMKNPEALQNCDQHLKTLLHGDLWHNNIYFHDRQDQLLFGSWQMCHYGSAATDLCFFLCSSTTTTFRRDHWDRIIRLYFDEFSKNLKDFVGNDAKLPTYDEFLIDVRASIPISIFFCANFRDLDQSESFSSMDSDMDPVFGNEGLQKESIQNLRGSFHKLQNSYSVYFLHDSSQTIREDETDDDKSSSDEGSDDDDDEGGIIISFGAGSSIDQPKPKPAIVTAGSPGSSQPKTKSPKTSAATASTLQPVLLDRKPVAKVPTVASEKELQDILEARSNGLRQRKKSLDPRKARALRRKLYLDLYGEMSQRMLI